MTLDEAIKHEEWEAEQNYRLVSTYHTDEGVYLQEETLCRLCAERHEQIAEWLKELKELKQNNTTKPVITKSDIEKANEIFNDKDFWRINDKANKLLNINTSECEYNYDCEHCDYWELTRVCKKCNNREQTNTTERKIANWIYSEGNMKCSNCGTLHCCDGKYCMECGAKMNEI